MPTVTVYVYPDEIESLTDALKALDAGNSPDAMTHLVSLEGFLVRIATALEAAEDRRLAALADDYLAGEADAWDRWGNQAAEAEPDDGDSDPDVPL